MRREGEGEGRSVMYIFKRRHYNRRYDKWKTRRIGEQEGWRIGGGWSIYLWMSTM